MKKPLIDVLLMSEKRKQALLLLQDSAKEMEYLLKSLGTTRQALLPQIRILEEHHLVNHYEDTYGLTAIGRLTVDEMAPLVGTLEILDADIDYWGTHDFDFIPPALLKRIKELRSYEIINPPLADLYSLHKTYHHNKITEYVYSVGNIFYPDYQSRFTEMIDNKITTNYIVSENLFDKVRNEYYEDFKVFIKSKYFNLYVYDKNMNFLFFTFDDYHIVINMLKKNGDVDSKYILCSTKDALKWGKDLFDHYLKDSTPITEI
ncbi:MAG: winged helix-turn-helix domain-containing protein [Methanolobus sp.]|uniref:helix-turn-helix transcriptional regulator n=1 Tax=Methanolobus sp. TaxID=1874737 RepID=UPI002730D95D|nr:winged helix-turn-helix domain-containing protein [Methanolobus sp.]MDP2217604.1 winged helix-turn-helix domain-containing protein [Methanolobus sp.]